MSLFRRTVKVQTETLLRGHLYRIGEDGEVVDLGPGSVEDLRLVAVAVNQAYLRLGAAKMRMTASGLSRARGWSRAVYDRAVK